MTRSAAALILMVHFILLLLTAKEKSATSDEPFHIARGAAALFSGDFRMSVAHPPLVNLISALPLLGFRELQLPFADRSWWDPRVREPERKERFARYFLWVHDHRLWKGNPDPLRIIFWMRVPIMGLSVILGLLIYMWSSRLGGRAAGIFSLLLYAFSPTVLAHACLVTTDIGSALFIFLFAFVLERHLARPTWNALGWCGLTFGLAQLSKFTAILLLPLLPLVLIAAGPGPWRRRFAGFFAVSPRQPEFLSGIFACLIMLFLAGLVIWAGYGFELHSIHRFLLPPVEVSTRFSFTLKRLAAEVIAAISLPPPTYYFGLVRTLFDTEAHFHPLYFGGRISEEGWWYYYPALFVIKEPLSLLALMAGGAVILWRTSGLPRPTFAITLIFPAGIIFFFMFLNQKNIGLRHLLPVYPFFFLVLGRCTGIRAGKGVLPAAAWALVAAYSLNGILSFPDYLVHFNSLVGGPEGGLKYSVVGEDWGQDISALGKFTREKGIEKIYYKPYGNADPAAYGVPDVRYGCTEERHAGWWAVHVVDLRRPMHGKYGDCWQDFLQRKPVAVIHHTIYVYFLPEAEEKP